MSEMPAVLVADKRPCQACGSTDPCHILGAPKCIETCEANRKRIAELEAALKNVQKNCICNRHKGFDYGEKHPVLGICKTGRWLTPKEIAVAALLLTKESQ